MVTIKKMAETSFHIKEPGLNILPPGVERYIVTVSYTHLTLPTKRIV